MEVQKVAVSNDLTDTDTSEHKATVINKIILYKQSFADPGNIISSSPLPSHGHRRQ